MSDEAVSRKNSRFGDNQLLKEMDPITNSAMKIVPTMQYFTVDVQNMMGWMLHCCRECKNLKMKIYG